MSVTIEAVVEAKVEAIEGARWGGNKSIKLVVVMEDIKSNISSISSVTEGSAQVL